MNPNKIDTTDRKIIVAIAMITRVDIDKVAAAYQAHSEELEKWIVEKMEKMRG